MSDQSASPATDADETPLRSSNFRFTEFVTSGAFSLTLSRRQVTALADVVNSGGLNYAGQSGDALERRGLLERVPDPDEFQADRHQYRATHAGLLCAAMLGQAGLARVPADPVAEEMNALKREVEDRRLEAQAARMTARSALARLAKAEDDLDNQKRLHARDRLKVTLLPRDPTPDLSAAELADRATEPQA